MALTWTPSLETGIPLIDQQHKELIKHVDVLLDLNNKNRFNETLSFLDGYIARHFGDEYRMQVESKYPKAATHKGYHDKFTTTFKELKNRFEEKGETATNNIELHKTVVGWLKDHIMIHDKEFAEYYKNHRA